jgi:hypothetical protein
LAHGSVHDRSTIELENQLASLGSRPAASEEGAPDRVIKRGEASSKRELWDFVLEALHPPVY